MRARIVGRLGWAGLGRHLLAYVWLGLEAGQTERLQHIMAHVRAKWVWNMPG